MDKGKVKKHRITKCDLRHLVIEPDDGEIRECQKCIMLRLSERVKGKIEFEKND